LLISSLNFYRSIDGGIGSIIQTREGGSLLIEDFLKWPIQQKIINNQHELKDQFRIHEDRLVARLKKEFFSNITSLFRIPQTKCQYGMTQLKDENSAISATFFPKYFFCPKCRKLKHIGNWQVGDGKGYPTCNCNDYTKKLEQVRFVLASESGMISDVPWEQFLDSNGRAPIPFKKDVKGNKHLAYGTSGSAESLSAISVHEKDETGTSVKSKNLGSLPEITFIDEDGNNYKMQLRQSNSICYVKTVSSIFIPEYYPPVLELHWIDHQISSWEKDNIVWDNTKLFERFRGEEQFTKSKTSITHIEKYLQETMDKTEANSDITQNEDEYRKAEFEYFLHPTDLDSTELIIDTPLHINTLFIKALYNIKKLKQTTAQTGYCRIRPEASVIPVGGSQTRYFPAVEMYGEGILFEFDCEEVKNKLSEEQNVRNFIHTFSHVIMKELEFECGYSVTTLRERLYCHFGQENLPIKLGVLIYALSGSDGSMGGLSSLFNNSETLEEKNIFKIIQNAIYRSQDCPNDPICSAEEDSANNNRASCYACTLIPETSCEKFNKELDRANLITFFSNQ